MTRRDSHDAFYVGYKPTADPALAGWLRRWVVAGLLIVPVVALALVSAQQPFAESVFEFGDERPFSGRVDTAPYPLLHTDDAPRPALLVGVGKLGADRQVEGLAGKNVRLQGTRIYYDDQLMIELRPESVERLVDASPQPASTQALGHVELIGEIVDSKCYLGVMKPGRGKPHRSCAARCISGGVPPIFLIEDALGHRRSLLLIGEDGRPIGNEVLDFVAEPLAIKGELSHVDGLLYLRAELTGFRRLGAGG